MHGQGSRIHCESINISRLVRGTSFQCLFTHPLLCVPEWSVDGSEMAMRRRFFLMLGEEGCALVNGVCSIRDGT